MKRRPEQYNRRMHDSEETAPWEHEYWQEDYRDDYQNNYRDEEEPLDDGYRDWDYEDPYDSWEEEWDDEYDRRYSREYRNRKRKRRKGKSALTVLLIIIIVLAAGVLGLSIYKLLDIRRSYQAADDVYAEIESIISGDKKDEEDREKLLADDTGFSWNYDKLLELCSDAVGYIFQKDVMSYPIVQAEDNDKYLRTLMNGEYNVAGTIFVDARCEEGMEGKYSIVYGHNMYNEGMFGTLPNYEDEAYYKEHPYFDIYIGYRHYRYYVFSAFVAEAEGYVYTYSIPEGQYKAQFDRLRADGKYQTDFRELREDDHVIVLSTCVNFHDYSYRNVVCLVRGEEVETTP